MANQTITGCVDYTVTPPQITFFDTECSSQELCGELQSDGTIDVYHSGCDDTYTACIDYSVTPARFKVTIPDDCCSEPCADCSPETTPRYVDVTFSGIVHCTWCVPLLAWYGGDCKYTKWTLNTTLNTTHRLEQTIWPCVFSKVLVDGATYKLWTGSTCPSTPDCWTQDVDIIIEAWRTASDVRLKIYKTLRSDITWYLDNYTVSSKCFTGSSASDYSACGNPIGNIGYDGSATIVEV